MGAIRIVFACAVLSFTAAAQQHVSFPSPDGGTVHADLYGKGERGLVLVHGGQFKKESWIDQANEFSTKGFAVISIDLRGFGQSSGPGQSNIYTAPLQLDVLAAVHYLKQHGAKTVSVVGGSMGGSAAADASIASEPGEIDAIVLLGAAPNGPAEKIKSRTLFIVAREDSNGAGPRLPGIRAAFDRAPEPKKLVVLEGTAHAQFLFQTDQRERVMREMLLFLSKP